VQICNFRIKFGSNYLSDGRWWHKGKAAAVTIVKAVRKLKALEEILEKMSGCFSIGAKKWRNTLTNYVKTKLQVDYNKSGISVAKMIIFSRQELLQRS